MKPKLYIETSVVSYLTAQPSREVVTSARQQITRDWWRLKRSKFDLFVSEFVVREARSGDLEAAARRLEALQGIPEISLIDDAAQLAEKLVQRGPLPEKASLDALHIGVAVCGGVDYLLTWNFKHLANAAMRRRIELVCRANGYEPCVICTPEELLEEKNDVPTR